MRGVNKNSVAEETEAEPGETGCGESGDSGRKRDGGGLQRGCSSVSAQEAEAFKLQIHGVHRAVCCGQNGLGA